MSLLPLVGAITTGVIPAKAGTEWDLSHSARAEASGEELHQQIHLRVAVDSHG